MNEAAARQLAQKLRRMPAPRLLRSPNGTLGHRSNDALGPFTKRAARLDSEQLIDVTQGVATEFNVCIGVRWHDGERVAGIAGLTVQLDQAGAFQHHTIASENGGKPSLVDLAGRMLDFGSITTRVLLLGPAPVGSRASWITPAEAGEAVEKAIAGEPAKTLWSHIDTKRIEQFDKSYHPTASAHRIWANRAKGMQGAPQTDVDRIEAKYSGPMVPTSASVSPTAIIHDGAVVEILTTVHDNATVGAHTKVERHCIISTGARVGERCHLGGGVHIDDTATVGSRTRLHSRVMIRVGAIIGSNVQIGEKSEIGPRSIIGAGTKVHSNVRIENSTIVERNCEIGNNSKIGKNVKIENEVVIGRGVTISNARIRSASAVPDDSVIRNDTDADQFTIGIDQAKAEQRTPDDKGKTPHGEGQPTASEQVA